MTDLDKRVASRLQGFGDNLGELPNTAAALAKGYQFNAYDSASNDDDDADDECEMLVCLGPITDALLVCRVTGRATANMVADALTIASSLRALATTREQPNHD